MARVLIASANPWSFALAVERQIAREHASDEVDMLDLWSICGRYSPHWSARDRLIERLNRKIPRLLKPAINGRDITTRIRPDQSQIPPVPAEVTGLRNYRIDEIPVGLAVLSSVFELTSIQDGRSPADYGGVFEDAWRSAHLSLQIGQKVAGLGYERVYIFGGRHSYSRPLVDAVSKTAAVFRYEQGGTGTSYILASESLYDPVNLGRIIAALPFDEQAGSEFFEERLNRSKDWDAGFFTGDQEVGRIPETIRGRPLVTFFNSSVDEFFAIKDEVRFGAFETQGQAALAMARICRDEGKAFAVRFHPHLKFKHDSWRNEWDFSALESLGAVLIEPDDPTDTYALARESECVFSCGSSISFECSYLGIPNASLGEGLSSALGAAPVVIDEADIRSFIRSPHLPPDARQNSLRLGSFFKKGAIPVARLDVGRHPNLARIDGRVVDPLRYLFQRVRELGSSLSGTPAENRSGMVDGRVVLPSSKRYWRA